MFPQVIRHPRHLAPCRSSLRQHSLLSIRLASTSPESTSDSTEPVLPSSPDTAKKATQTLSANKNNRRTAYLRTWEPVRSIADAWAIIRVLERKYGKIISGHFLKDYENPTKYQLMSWVVFEDPASVARIPRSGYNFSIPLPGIDKPAYEIGMEDLENLAVPAKYEPGFEIPTPEPGTGKVIGAVITPSDTEYNSSLFANRIYQNSNFRTMEAFVGWAGFSPLKPIPPRRHSIREHELFSVETEDEQIRMRAALEISARYTYMRNPGVLSPGQIAESENVSKAVEKVRKGKTMIEVEASRVESEPLGAASTTTATATPAEPSPKPSSLSPKPSESATIEAIQSKPTPAPLTPEQLEAERLAKQEMELALDVAKRLAARTAIDKERRKQPKPTVKSAKPKKNKKGAVAPQGDYFYDFVAKPPKNLTVMDRLWGLFGR